MEIVKQRKRRLLAWILVMTLGICMWQSNVFASEETGGSNSAGDSGSVSENTTPEGEDGGTQPDLENPKANEPTIIEDESVDPYRLYIKFCQVKKTEDGSAEMIDVKFANKPTTTLKEWIEGDSGGYSDGTHYEAEISADMQVLSGITFSEVLGDSNDGENDLKHNVLNWWYMDEDAQNKCINETSSNLDLSFVKEKIKLKEVYANLGSVAIITYTDDTGKSYAKEKIIEQSLDKLKWYVTLPECRKEDQYKEDGNFFLGWKKSDDEEIKNAGERMEGDYEEFVTNINITPVYDVLVNKAGEFSFLAGKEYKLNKGTWEGGDGYSYVVENENQPFFVSEDCSFEFK